AARFFSIAFLAPSSSPFHIESVRAFRELGRSIETTQPAEYWRTPIHPHCLVKIDARIVSHDVRISGAAADQEFLDVSIHFRLLRRGEGAVRMTGGQRVPHPVGYAMRLPNHASCVCRTPGTLRTKPQNIILDDQYCARCNQPNYRVMVERELCRRAAELTEI